MSLVDAAAVVTTNEMFDYCNRFNSEVVGSDIGVEKVGELVFVALIQDFKVYETNNNLQYVSVHRCNSVWLF